MATMVEVAAQRMLMKRPTVARTSETGIGPAGRSPTRASEPRTEITRPKDVTMLNLDVMEWTGLHYGRPRLAKRLNRQGSASAKCAASRSGFVLRAWRGMRVTQENQRFRAFPGSRGAGCGLTTRLPRRRRGPDRRRRPDNLCSWFADWDQQVYRANRLLTASCNAPSICAA